MYHHFAFVVRISDIVTSTKFIHVKNLIRKAKMLIAQGQLKQAIDLLLASKLPKQHFDNVVLVSYRFTSLLKDTISGILSNEEISLMRARTAHSLMSQLSLMKENVTFGTPLKKILFSD